MHTSLKLGNVPHVKEMLCAGLANLNMGPRIERVLYAAGITILVNSRGNPGGFFSNPDPTRDKPPPMREGLGFCGFGLGFPGVGRVQKTAWVGDPHTCLRVRVASGSRVVRRVQETVHPYTF